MSVRESLTTRRKDSDDAKTRGEGMPGEQPGGSLVPGQVASGVQGTGLQSGLPGRPGDPCR
jgi:hypothetical protein